MWRYLQAYDNSIAHTAKLAAENKHLWEIVNNDDKPQTSTRAVN